MEVERVVSATVSFPETLLVAACVFQGDPGADPGPRFLSNYAFDGFVKNGEGDYTLLYRNVAGCIMTGAVMDPLDGDPKTFTMTVNAHDGEIGVVTTNLDGTPADTIFGVLVTKTPGTIGGL